MPERRQVAERASTPNSQMHRVKDKDIPFESRSHAAEQVREPTIPGPTAINAGRRQKESRSSRKSKSTLRANPQSNTSTDKLIEL